MNLKTVKNRQISSKLSILIKCQMSIDITEFYTPNEFFKNKSDKIPKYNTTKLGASNFNFKS